METCKHGILQELRKRVANISKLNKRIIGISFVIGIIGNSSTKDARTAKEYLESMQDLCQEMIQDDNDWLNS